MDKIEKVLERLHELSEGAMPKRRYWGICYELSNVYNYDVPKRYFLSWKYFSGDLDYPVFDTDNRRYSSPELQYAHIRELWEGNQGKLRKDLCKHLITKFPKEQGE